MASYSVCQNAVSLGHKASSGFLGAVGGVIHWSLLQRQPSAVHTYKSTYDHVWSAMYSFEFDNKGTMFLSLI